MSDLDAAIRATLDRQRDTMTVDDMFVSDITGKWQEAILAVLELHRPAPNPPGPLGALCAHCLEGGPGYEAEAVFWPCPTVLAIAKGLGIEA